ncbi:DNA-directed RNA polymerase subunit alpha [Chitinivibrio alkaliphilus]|uniref:DNA-directed RNA polymerase subunit alpha n=1 Tax=Chitinivibrio alkaliphilus ACht1 TaxID=1313304 RepID=U7D5R6_9BACT|nr:DNA-directed RNA polymerase subunit alpha [Chitinivibrio alkaliphilus]ERP31313.1 DNA-directed RNA polymerase, alpha subunit [Chitinivibrio alkaliphilus ACht1]
MKWKSLLMPKGITVENPNDIPNYGKVIVEPLERGWGHTIGNGLRRVMLSSLQGAAVTSIRIDGALHEFSTVSGVKEDVTDIILNIKKLRLRLIADEPQTLKVNLKGSGVVTAGDIEDNPNVDVLNPDLVLATVNEDADSSIEMYVYDGKGYVASDENKKEDDDITSIPIDAIFSPVTRVNYAVESIRVGQRADLDKLVMDVWTDGSLSIHEAVGYSAKIFYDHLDRLINIDAKFESIEEEVVDEKTEKLRQLLLTKIDDLELSVRSNNCLRAANIRTLADLVRNQESDMLKYKNFGRKSLVELNQVLADKGLAFGMDIDDIMGDDEE